MSLSVQEKKDVQFVKSYDSKDSLREKLVTVALETLQTIAADMEKRVQGYKNDPSLLGGGVWYANEYMRALKETKNERNLTTLINSNSFFHGFAPKSHFALVRDDRSPTGMPVLGYVIKEGVPANEALDTMQKGITFLDCERAYKLSYLKAIEKVLGAEKFNILFESKNTSQYPLFASPALHALLVKISLKSLDTIKKGQCVHFHSAGPGYNYLYYLKKHPNGEGAGYYGLCNDDTKGKTKFVAMGLNSKGVSQEEIRDALLKEYNKTPISTNEIYSEKLIKCFAEDELQSMKSRDHQFTSKEFKKEKGGDFLPYVYDFDVERISQLAAASLEQAYKLMQEWTKSGNNIRASISNDIKTHL